MQTGIRFATLLLAALLLCFIQLPAADAQDVEPLKFFRDYVGPKEDQITDIRNGKAVAKVVESRTPDEVFVFGSVYVHSTPGKYLTLASDLEVLRKLASYLAIWPQMTHLLAAEMFWILLILASVDQLFASHRSGVPFSRKASAGVSWSCGFKGTGHISRGRGHSL